MTFKLPEVTDIEADVDGRRVTGAYSVMLGDLVVYYNGHTSSIRKPTRNMRELAIEMLQELARKNYIGIESVPSELPQHIREAAVKYANCPDDDELIRELIVSFGPSTVGSDVHVQVSWLCVNAVQPIAPFWKAMCDDDTPEQTLLKLRRWMNDRAQPVDWELARRTLVGYRDGRRIEDCDACRVEPIAKALASCADYLHTAHLESAVETILEAWGAYSEGCWPESEERPFERWAVEVAIPNAYHSRPAV